jgi:hypothetical protein
VFLNKKNSSSSTNPFVLLLEYNDTDEDNELENAPCETVKENLKKKKLVNTDATKGVGEALKNVKETPAILPFDKTSYQKIFQKLVEDLRFIRKTCLKYENEDKILQNANIDKESLKERVKCKYMKKQKKTKKS